MRVQVKMTEEEHPEGASKELEQFQSLNNIYALGDCSANIGNPLPALAQACPLYCPCTSSVCA